MKTVTPSPPIVAIIGSPDLSRRIGAAIQQTHPGVHVLSGSLAEAWGNVLTHHPHCLIIEVGIYHSPPLQQQLRRFLLQLRERFGSEVYICIALASCERFYFGGDLLFQGQSMTPSHLVDNFLAVAPGGIPSLPSLVEQVQGFLPLLMGELERRAFGKLPLPALNDPGWVASVADPSSRELWMKWLPRYASYTNENPIIIGETGTGKTSLSYALHLLSGRSGEFVSITPRDFSSSELVQAELFGAVAGAYTGAVDKWGLVKKAEKGTLFIDELQSIDKELQGKLITFIENKTYRRVGSSETVEADVRFVFASNRSLYDMMQSDVLRHDFAYRLERVQLELTPLHERRLDITAGLAYALAKVYRQRPHMREVEGFSSDAYRMLFSHSWPGNLRQLENAVARLCELADMQHCKIIERPHVVELLKSRLFGKATTAGEVLAEAGFRLSKSALLGSFHSLDEGVDRFVSSARETALEVSGGDFQRAAALLEEDVEILRLFAQSHLLRTRAEEAQ